MNEKLTRDWFGKEYTLYVGNHGDPEGLWYSISEALKERESSPPHPIPKIDLSALTPYLDHIGGGEGTGDFFGCRKRLSDTEKCTCGLDNVLTALLAPKTVADSPVPLIPSSVDLSGLERFLPSATATGLMVRVERDDAFVKLPDLTALLATEGKELKDE